MRPHGAFDAEALRRLSDEQDYPLLAVGAEARMTGAYQNFQRGTTRGSNAKDGR